MLIDTYNQDLVPGAITYGSFCYGLFEEGNADASLHLEERMLEFGVTPASISYFNGTMDAAFGLIG